jgi:hypothetical protein
MSTTPETVSALGVEASRLYMQYLYRGHGRILFIERPGG